MVVAVATVVVVGGWGERGNWSARARSSSWGITLRSSFGGMGDGGGLIGLFVVVVVGGGVVVLVVMVVVAVVDVEEEGGEALVLRLCGPPTHLAKVSM